MSEFVQGLHKLLDRFSAEPGPDSVVNKRRIPFYWRPFLSRVSQQMWSPPGLNVESHVESLRSPRSGVVAHRPLGPLVHLFQIRWAG